MSLGTAPYTPDVPLSFWERITARWHRWRATRTAEELHADIMHDFSLMSPEEREREIDRFLPPALRRHRADSCEPCSCGAEHAVAECPEAA